MAESRRKIRRKGAAAAPPSRWRLVAASVVGLLLIGSAYQFAFATGNVGFEADYGPTTDTGDTTGGSSTPGGSRAPDYGGSASSGCSWTTACSPVA